MNFNKLLVLNSGSSSLKFKLFEVFDSLLSPLCYGLCERLGDSSSGRTKFSKFSAGGAVSSTSTSVPMKDHTVALEKVNEYLQSQFSTTLESEVGIVAHRVVHGLHLSAPAIVDNHVRDVIQRAASLAPLHNPPNLMGIEAASKIYRSAHQVAVFDTAFHTTLSAAASTYPLPQELCHRLMLRKYGFHGSSYTFVMKKACEHLEIPPERFNGILCHLGAGSSMCCVKNGASMDVTMGLTPLEGLMMATRCGDVDPGLILHLLRSGMDVKDVDTLLNKKSGFLGVAGNPDLRVVQDGAAKGDASCKLAIDIFVHRILRYLGAFAMYLSGEINAVVFTGGIGEHSTLIRQRVCERSEWLGLKLDPEKNRDLTQVANSQTGVHEIQKASSKIPILVIETDEELSIAEQALTCVSG